jgi:hypothetical protein|tara:strand:- start:275 stop:643 length:369 start_codon:yes stop_codon:yes gene_type:complete
MMVLPLEQVDPRGRRGVTHNRKGQQLAACDDCVRIAGAFSAASSSPADPCGGALFNRDCGCQLCGGRVMLLGQQHEHISWCTCLEQDEAERAAEGWSGPTSLKIKSGCLPEFRSACLWHVLW